MNNNPVRHIRKIGLAVIANKQLLMARSYNNDHTFYFIGGTVEPGESDLACLQREVIEEVGVPVSEESLQFLVEFSAPAHGKENTMLTMAIYLGNLIGTPKPSSEIVELRYFDSSYDPKNLTVIGEKAIKWLKENNYIN